MSDNAIVYCQGEFCTTSGKTAHGLVRRSQRFRVVAVIDSTLAGRDADAELPGAQKGIPLVADLASALRQGQSAGKPATHFIIGLAPDGGRLPADARQAVLDAIDAGLNVVSGLHDFLCEIPEIAERAARRGVALVDVRKPPPRDQLHFFSGKKIAEVQALKLAVLGTDSAVGKRTTAWLLVDALARAGLKAEMIGTGQTAWMQGARYGVRLDSLINDYVSGEIEHAVWSAWREQKPEALVIEGQGSLMHPAYPGGFEILAAARPDGVIMQHAPGRAVYDGFPEFPLHPLDVQIRATELVSGRPVVAVTVNNEGLTSERLAAAKQETSRATGRPVCAPLIDGAEGMDRLVEAILRRFGKV